MWRTSQSSGVHSLISVIYDHDAGLYDVEYVLRLCCGGEKATLPVMDRPVSMAI